MSAPADCNVMRTFWHGPELSSYEQLSLASFVKHGHTVQLFAYRDLPLPAGVEWRDASAILPESAVFAYRNGPGKGSFAAFANLFRYQLLHDLGGTWIDSDILCLRSFADLPAASVAWQDKHLLNNAVLRFPAGHPITAELCARARKLGPGIQWGEAGPHLLTDVVQSSTAQIALLPPALFYPIPWGHAWKVLYPQERDACAQLAQGAYCVHWWNEALVRFGLRKHQGPPVGSYLHQHWRALLGESNLATWTVADVDGWIDAALAAQQAPAAPSAPFAPAVIHCRAERFEANPIIRPDMLPGVDGRNINGPSLIRAPAWLARPLGKYYLYFAHRHGQYIRLAYADHLAGPWRIYQPGTLRLEQTVCARFQAPSLTSQKRVAAPDVHVDEATRQVRMYFHGPVYQSGPPENPESHRQLTLLAVSPDGLDFTAQPEPLGDPGFRVFQWRSAHYALSMTGTFFRSPDGICNWRSGPTLFSPLMRHAAVTVAGEQLQVCYSVVGENPERLLLTTIDLSRPWTVWRGTAPQVVLEPARIWEGADLPAKPSVRGWAPGPVRELRDPAFFVEDGRTYLLYAVAGESGLAIAEVHFDATDSLKKVP